MGMEEKTRSKLYTRSRENGKNVKEQADMVGNISQF